TNSAPRVASVAGVVSPGVRWASILPRKFKPSGTLQMIESLEGLIAGHSFFSNLKEEYVRSVTACASNLRFEAGTYICREGEPADHFYLIRQGRVAVEISAPPRKPIIVQTVSAGDVLGWSWLVPPYEWRFHARAVEPVRAIALDGKCLRTRCEENH